MAQPLARDVVEETAKQYGCASGRFRCGTVGIKPDGSPDRRHRKGKTEAEVTPKVRELEGKRETVQVAKPGKVPTVAEWMAEYLDVICPRVWRSKSPSRRRPARGALNCGGSGI